MHCMTIANQNMWYFSLKLYANIAELVFGKQIITGYGQIVQWCLLLPATLKSCTVYGATDRRYNYVYTVLGFMVRA